MEAKHLVIGVKTSQQMFRLSSLSGGLVDEILELRGKGKNSYRFNNYNEVQVTQDNNTIILRNYETDDKLHIDKENIIFMVSNYNNDDEIDIDSAFSEFEYLWKLVNRTLKVQNIRRIGVVLQNKQNLENENASKFLMNKLNVNNVPAHPAKFNLRYENRRMTKEGIAKDFYRGDFFNTIYNYYDSSNEDESNTQNSINVNIDVQRYFSPQLNGQELLSEINKLKKHFFDEKTSLYSSLKNMGFIDGKE